MKKVTSLKNPTRKTLLPKTAVFGRKNPQTPCPVLGGFFVYQCPILRFCSMRRCTWLRCLLSARQKSNGIKAVDAAKPRMCFFFMVTLFLLFTA